MHATPGMPGRCQGRAEGVDLCVSGYACCRILWRCVNTDPAWNQVPPRGQIRSPLTKRCGSAISQSTSGEQRQICCHCSPAQRLERRSAVARHEPREAISTKGMRVGPKRARRSRGRRASAPVRLPCLGLLRLYPARPPGRAVLLLRSATLGRMAGYRRRVRALILTSVAARGLCDR